MSSRIRIFVQGLVMGATEVIPGVSSSTLALVMGIYEKYIEFLFELAEAVKQTFLRVLKLQRNRSRSLKQVWGDVSWGFGGMLIAGMLVAILSLAKILAILLETNENAVFAFFFGLVLGAVWLPFRRISQPSVLIMVLAAVTTFLFFSLFHFANPVSIAPPLWLFFVGGFVGISAMVLPGISGSFVLLVIGVYEPAVQLVSQLLSGEISVIGLAGLASLGGGVLAGFLVFIRFVRYALKTYHDVLMAVLGGLMLASLRFLWPFVEVTDEARIPQSPLDFAIGESILFIVLILIGVSVVSFLYTQNGEKCT